MRIRAVTFDVGGTLIEPWPSVGQIYASVAHSLGHAAPDPEKLATGFIHAWAGRGAFDYSRSAWRKLVEQSFAAAGVALAGACFDAIYARFGQAAVWRVFDDVQPVLTELRARGIAVALVSNWDERLRPLLNELKLMAMVDSLIVSHEVGWQKPAPEMFAGAAKCLGVAPGEILHIGDSEGEDYLGARGAGLQALWLRRESAHGADEIGSLRPLVERVHESSNEQ